MRLASEQQLARDCLNSVDVCDRLGPSESVSIESLMTLLWAIQVIEKEQGSKLDAATEVRQACDELDILFRKRDVNGRVHFASGTRGVGTIGQKSLEDWRLEF